MTGSDSLFQLVHSLSQSEKRHFTRFAGLQTPAKVNQYQALFNRLCKLKEYDPVLLKKEFGKTHFEQLKQQLYRKILQSLRHYHESADISSRIEISRMNYQLLAARGLSVQAAKELDKATAIAEESGLLYQQAILFRHRMKNFLQYAEPGEARSFFYEHERFCKMNAELVAGEIRYENLFIQADLINKQFEATRNRDELKLISDFLKNPLLKNEKQAASPRGKLLFFFTKGLASYLICNFSACADLMDRCIQIAEAHPFLCQSEEEIFIRAIANRTLALFHSGKTDAFRKSLAELKKLKTNFPSTQNYLAEITSVLELMRLNREKKYAEAVSRINFESPAMNFLSGTKQISQQKTYYTFQLATAFWGAGDFKKASAVISRFINERGKGMKKDAYLMARILFMLIRFEMNDEALLQSELRSTYRLLKKENKLFLFEKSILQFIAAMQTANTPQQIRKNFRKLKTSLDELSGIEYERNAFMYFDFRAWVNKFLN